MEQKSAYTDFSKEAEAKVHQVDNADSHSSHNESLRGHDHKNDRDVHPIHYPSRWAYVRHHLREPVAEFLGTMILMIFGNGVNCQVALSANPGVAPTQRGSYLSISFGWAIGAALGIWTSGSISGGHINPAVTLCFAIFRGFPWKKVPVYWSAQVMGAMCGAGIVYANYFHAIDIFEGGRGIRTVPGTASLFATYTLNYMTSASSFFNEFIGTAMLLLVVFAATDKGIMTPPSGLLPLVVFILLLGIGACLGMQTGYSINPARDLGPRLLTATVGYGREVFTYRNHYWIWCPIMAPFLGGIVGSLVYDSFLHVGSKRVISRPNHDESSDRSARAKVPAEVDVV